MGPSIRVSADTTHLHLPCSRHHTPKIRHSHTTQRDGRCTQWRTRQRTRCGSYNPCSCGNPRLVDSGAHSQPVLHSGRGAPQSDTLQQETLGSQYGPSVHCIWEPPLTRYVRVLCDVMPNPSQSAGVALFTTIVLDAASQLVLFCSISCAHSGSVGLFAASLHLHGPLPRNLEKRYCRRCRNAVGGRAYTRRDAQAIAPWPSITITRRLYGAKHSCQCRHNTPAPAVQPPTYTQDPSLPHTAKGRPMYPVAHMGLQLPPYE